MCGIALPPTCAEAFTRLPRHGLTLNEMLTFLAGKKKKKKEVKKHLFCCASPSVCYTSTFCHSRVSFFLKYESGACKERYSSLWFDIMSSVCDAQWVPWFIFVTGAKYSLEPPHLFLMCIIICGALPNDVQQPHGSAAEPVAFTVTSAADTQIDIQEMLICPERLAVGCFSFYCGSPVYWIYYYFFFAPTINWCLSFEEKIIFKIFLNLICPV